MSNIVTAVKVAVDSSDLDETVKTSKSVNEELGPKLTAGLGKATIAFAAVSGAAYAIYSALEDVNNKVREAADTADDFTSAMDEASRTRLLQVAADVGVVDDELARLHARQAAAMADTSDWFDQMVLKAEGIKTSLIESIFGTPRSIEEIEQEIQGVNAAIEAGTGTRIQQAANLDKSIRLEKELAAAQSASNEYAVSQAKYLNTLDAQRAAQLRRFNRDQIDALREEMEAQIAVYDAQIAQDPTPEVIANLEFQKETARLVGEARIQQAQDLQQAELDRINETEEREKQAAEDREKREADSKQRIADREYDIAVMNAARIAEDSIKTTENAISGVLNTIDSDLAKVYTSIDELSKLLQALELIGGAGGILGMVGGGSFSAGGMSSFGGVSVGSVSVHVTGNTDTQGMKNATQEGIYTALNGIVKDTMAKESKYGGILNPNSQVLSM